MTRPIHIQLSESGWIRDLPCAPEQTRPWVSSELGEYISYNLGYLDDYAEQLSIAKISSFFDGAAESEVDESPKWHEAEQGVRTLQALVTELIGRLGTNDTFEYIEFTLWELRMYELILLRARQAGELFYLDA